MSEGMYAINPDLCAGCGNCAGNGPVQAIEWVDAHYEITGEDCTSCGQCMYCCPVGAVYEK